MSFEYGEQRDANGNITHEGSWGVKSTPTEAFTKVIENFRTMMEDGIVVPANIDAEKVISGVLDIARIPQAALERLTQVPNQAARFALTTDTVQLGDTVKQLDTGIMYVVVDTTNLENESGYVSYAAGTAASVPWSGVTGKPTTITGYGITDALPKSGGNLSGALNETTVTLASAATLNIGAAAGNYIIVAGTTTITAFDSAQAGTRRILRFQNALTVTHSSALGLPNSASITVTAGETMEFLSLGSGNWRCINYQPIAGYAPAGTYLRLTSTTYSDLDSFTTPNQWFSFDTGNGAMANTPEGTLAQGSARCFRVMNIGSTNRIMQYFESTYPAAKKYIAIRTYDGNSFSAWVQLALTDSPTFTGTITTAGQIKFPSIPNPSSDANTLDDYEEGTWIPTITASTANPTITYASQIGTYTKIGRMVHAQLRLDFTITAAGAGYLIASLPFVSYGTHGLFFATGYSDTNNVENINFISIATGSAVASLRVDVHNGQTNAATLGRRYFVVCFSYVAAS